MRNIAKSILPVVLIGFVLTGCGSGVSENKPVSEVKAEARTMSVDQLKATVAKYKAAIESKKTEIGKLTAKIQKIPVTQMLGNEAKKLKGDIQNVTNSVRALTERLNVYTQELRSKMYVKE